MNLLTQTQGNRSFVFFVFFFAPKIEKIESFVNPNYLYLHIKENTIFRRQTLKLKLA